MQLGCISEYRLREKQSQLCQTLGNKKINMKTECSSLSRAFVVAIYADIVNLREITINAEERNSSFAQKQQKENGKSQVRKIVVLCQITQASSCFISVEGEEYNLKV
ncbi:hypothetical protein LOAG_01641 [Loa loa]|uniref:Uncharacterized protein n=1 Tax=Loa loa TaxID=7209 RepID=A0A1S0U961_LOALO|nr:hypothetical protein LOAG_01641 [Loa loa]EFO26844.1 hypothetical protein LOAG_01641 [Loa loa]